MREMPWPCEDADFYRHDRKSKYRINLKCSGEISKQFHKFSDNFFCAAHAITEYILDRRRIGELDLFFFPLAYMYRHSLELKMKAIAFQYLETGEEKQFINDTFHNLTEILSWLEPYICGKIAIDGESFLWMKALFVDMEPIDKESDAFRYPFRIVERKDTLWATKHYEIKKFFDGQKNINLVSFANKMELSYEILNSYYYKREQAFKEHNELSTLFLEEGGAYYGQSVIGYDYHRDFYGPMVRGYSQVGELLARWIEEDSDKKDIYFWPMCYVFRNTVELELKQIWFEECNEVFSVKCEKLYNCKHSYHKMWQLIDNDLINHSRGEGDSTVIVYAKKYIEQLHSIDPLSSLFRYPVDKNGTFFFKTDRFVDANNVSEFFCELSEFLQAVDSMMNEHNDILAEMAAEAQNYM